MNDGVIRIRKESLAQFRNATQKGIFVALIERADENGFLQISVNAFAKEVGVGRQEVRTVLQKLEANQLINQQATNKQTNITFCKKAENATAPPTEKPTTNQLTNQQRRPQKNTINHLPAVTLGLDFVDPMFEDPFNTWLDYKKRQFKFTYKTERSLRAAYSDLVKLSDGRPDVAVAIVEQAMSNGWKGLYPLKQNGTENYHTQKMQSDTRRAGQSNELAKRLREAMDAIACENGC